MCMVSSARKQTAAAEGCTKRFIGWCLESRRSTAVLTSNNRGMFHDAAMIITMNVYGQDSDGQPSTGQTFPRV
jgi:hypothetical protein